MIEVHMRQEWVRDTWGILVYERTPTKRYYYPDVDRAHRVEISERALRPAEVPPYTLELPTDWMQAIVAAANEEAGLTPPNTSQQRHLDDAMYVRDRLLDAMIPPQP